MEIINLTCNAISPPLSTDYEDLRFGCGKVKDHAGKHQATLQWDDDDHPTLFDAD